VNSTAVSVGGGGRLSAVNLGTVRVTLAWLAVLVLLVLRTGTVIPDMAFGAPLRTATLLLVRFADDLLLLYTMVAFEVGGW
jgi:hypothetical protein